MLNRPLPSILCWLLVLTNLSLRVEAAEVVGRITDADSGQSLQAAVIRAIPLARNLREVRATSHARYYNRLIRGNTAVCESPRLRYLPNSFCLWRNSRRWDRCPPFSFESLPELTAVAPLRTVCVLLIWLLAGRVYAMQRVSRLFTYQQRRILRFRARPREPTDPGVARMRTTSVYFVCVRDTTSLQHRCHQLRLS